MADRFPKFTEDVEVISKLGDSPGADDNLTTEQLKAKFDQAPKAIKEYLVSLVGVLEELFGSEGGALSGGNLTGNLNINLYKIFGIRTPSDPSDAANKEYVDNGLGGKMDKTGGNFSGEVQMGGNAIKGLPHPITDSEPSTKAYVDEKRKVFSSSILAEWSGNKPYVQTVTVPGILTSDIPHITPVYSADPKTAAAQKEAWGYVDMGIAKDGKITFTCLEDKPETAIPIQIEVMR